MGGFATCCASNNQPTPADSLCEGYTPLHLRKVYPVVFEDVLDTSTDELALHKS